MPVAIPSHEGVPLNYLKLLKELQGQINHMLTVGINTPHLSTALLEAAVAHIETLTISDEIASIAIGNLTATNTVGVNLHEQNGVITNLESTHSTIETLDVEEVNARALNLTISSPRNIIWDGDKEIPIAILGTVSMDEYWPDVLVAGTLDTTQAAGNIPVGTDVDVAGLLHGSNNITAANPTIPGMVFLYERDKRFSFVASFTKDSVTALYTRDSDVTLEGLTVREYTLQGGIPVYALCMKVTGTGNINVSMNCWNCKRVNVDIQFPSVMLCETRTIPDLSGFSVSNIVTDRVVALEVLTAFLLDEYNYSQTWLRKPRTELYANLLPNSTYTVAKGTTGPGGTVYLWNGDENRIEVTWNKGSISANYNQEGILDIHGVLATRAFMSLSVTMDNGIPYLQVNTGDNITGPLYIAAINSTIDTTPVTGTPITVVGLDVVNGLTSSRFDLEDEYIHNSLDVHSIIGHNDPQDNPSEISMSEAYFHNLTVDGGFHVPDVTQGYGHEIRITQAGWYQYINLSGIPTCTAYIEFEPDTGDKEHTTFLITNEQVQVASSAGFVDKTASDGTYIYVHFSQTGIARAALTGVYDDSTADPIQWAYITVEPTNQHEAVEGNTFTHDVLIDGQMESEAVRSETVKTSNIWRPTYDAFEPLGVYPSIDAKLNLVPRTVEVEDGWYRVLDTMYAPNGVINVVCVDYNYELDWNRGNITLKVDVPALDFIDKVLKYGSEFYFHSLATKTIEVSYDCAINPVDNVTPFAWEKLDPLSEAGAYVIDELIETVIFDDTHINKLTVNDIAAGNIEVTGTATINDEVVTTSQIDALAADNATIDNVHISNGYAKLQQLHNEVGYIDNLTSDDINTKRISVTVKATINDEEVTTSHIDTLDADDAAIDTAVIGDLTATNITLVDLEVTGTATINDEVVTTSHIDTLDVDEATIDDATVTEATITDATIDNSTVHELIVSEENAIFKDLNVEGTLRTETPRQRNNVLTAYNPVNPEPVDTAIDAVPETVHLIADRWYKVINTAVVGYYRINLKQTVITRSECDCDGTITGLVVYNDWVYVKSGVNEDVALNYEAVAIDPTAAEFIEFADAGTSAPALGIPIRVGFQLIVEAFSMKDIHAGTIWTTFGAKMGGLADVNNLRVRGSANIHVDRSNINGVELFDDEILDQADLDDRIAAGSLIVTGTRLLVAKGIYTNVTAGNMSLAGIEFIRGEWITQINLPNMVLHVVPGNNFQNIQIVAANGVYGDVLRAIDNSTLRPRNGDGKAEVPAITTSITDDLTPFPDNASIAFPNWEQQVTNKINGILAAIAAGQTPPPVGYHYTQYYNYGSGFSPASDPNNMWPGTVWVIMPMGGLFFRTEGGYAAENRDANGYQAGANQLHGHGFYDPSHKHTMYLTSGTGSGSPRSDSFNNSVPIYADTLYAYTGASVYNSGGTETRPANCLMRLWRREA